MKIVLTCPVCGKSNWVREDDQFKCVACGETYYTEDMSARALESTGDGLPKMYDFAVRIVLSGLTVVADSAERAEEIAQDILDSDARTRLSHGLSVEGYEVSELGPSDEDEETEV